MAQGKIRFAVVGNGNLGRACKAQILERSEEFEFIGIFSRRESAETLLLSDIEKYKNKIDVVLFCGGSSNDAPEMMPEILKQGFSTVDSYDNHGEIKNGKYVNLLDKYAKENGASAIIGAGWDPGIMSIQRIINQAYMPGGVHNTFYGPGLSMGHTNAIKRIEGVVAAHQITMPREDAMQLALSGKIVPINDRHKRICFVVAEEGKEKSIEERIRNLPDYFKGQQVEVNFIDMETFEKDFTDRFGHGGQIISTGNNAKITWGTEMQSNPMMTASAMIAFGKASKKIQAKGWRGAFTIDEVPVSFLLDDEVRRGLI